MEQLYGAHSEEIKAAAGMDIELRTLQRRLGKLIERGGLKISGTRRTAKYPVTMRASRLN